MNKTPIIVTFVAASAMGQAFSFAGDWTFSADATLNYNTIIGSGSYNYADSSLQTVTQTVTDQFSFPANLGAVSGTGDFVVTGNTVTDVNGANTTDPFDINVPNFGNVTIRLTYPTWNLTGTIDGTNPGIVDGFGEYAYHITGDSVTVNNVRVEALIGSWIDLGTNNSFTINSWSLERDAVPEPATLSILGLAAVAAYKKRKKA